jgi:hypothetical protein
MSATNDAVFHRRNKQIQDAIDGQNLKQALQLIEKRMKKGEDSRFLKVKHPLPLLGVIGATSVPFHYFGCFQAM